MKHFINHDLLAPSVLTVPIDLEIVREFEDLAGRADTGPDYCTYRPSWNSDIRWISAASPSTFSQFSDAFDRLNIARHVREYLDIDREVRLYAGFLHTRTRCVQADFHIDWALTNNEAFTLLTPVCGSPNERLLYKTLAGDTSEYRYKMGEAIVFGDHFLHSTPPGTSDPPFTLLVFNFGTDRMEHWQKIIKTVGEQCGLLRRPDGEFENHAG